jgi:uncharacterized RDD family membrane protein YckC
MENSYSEAMSRLPEKKLIRLVTTERNSRDQLAVQAAEAELAKRGVGEQTIRKTSIQTSEMAAYVKKANSSGVQPWMRLCHAVIDFICFWICWVLVSAIVLAMLGDPFLIRISVWFTMVFSFLGYYTFMEWKFQRTVGMMLTGCKVIDLEGGKLYFSTALRRTMSRLVPFDAFSYLITGNMLHDRYTNTLVVRNNFIEEEAGPEKAFIPDHH